MAFVEDGVLSTSETFTDSTVDLSSLSTFYYIAPECFSNAPNLIAVTIPATVSSIGNNAFDSCTSLLDIQIEEDSILSTIGTGAFQYCIFNSIDLTVATQLTTIEQSGFKQNINLRSVFFPSSLTTIQENAFAFDQLLSTFIFPEGSRLSNIGVSAFQSNAFQILDLTSTQVQTINDYAFAYNSNLGAVFFPSSIGSISFGAFYNDSNLTTVSFPKGTLLTTISTYAFYYNSLHSLDLTSTQVQTIGDGAFADSSNLGAVFFPSSIESMGDSAFSNNNNLSTIIFPEGTLLTSIGLNAFQLNALSSLDLTSTQVQTIGDYAFANSSNLGAVFFPSSIVTIGNDAFSNNNNLSTIIFPEGALLNSIGLNAFQSNALSSLDLTSTQVLYIYNYAFADNSNLGGAQFPSSLSIINQNAFANDSNLSTISFSEGSALSLIDSYAFQFCGLTSLDLSLNASLNTINSLAFLLNSNLGSLTIPSSLSKISAAAFRQDSNLSTFFIPDGSQLIEIESYAFDHCSLTSLDLTLASSFTTIGGGAFSTNVQLGSARFPSSLTSIGNSAFQGCSHLSTIKFQGEIITTMNPSVFEGCSSLKEINVPNSVTKLDINAFKDAGIETFTLSSNITDLGKKVNDGYVFSNCPMFSINVPSTFNQFSILNTSNVGIDSRIMSTVYTFGENVNSRTGCDYSTYNFLTTPPQDKDKFKAIVRSTDLRLPLSTFDASYLVNETYSPSVFSNANIIAIGSTDESVVPVSYLPTTADKIAYIPININESVVFSNASSTYTIKLKAESTITLFQDDLINPLTASSNDYELNQSLTIGTKNYSFVGTGSLFLQPAYIWQVQDGVFSFLSNPHTDSTFDLDGAYETSNFWNIETYCFYSWPNLGQITIPLAVSTIGSGAFSSCSNLSTVLFKNCPIQLIDELVFQNCSSLKEIHLPNSVTEIAMQAFQRTGLQTITMPNNLSNLGDNVFGVTPLKCINVTSSFLNFNIFSDTSIGIGVMSMSTIYTIGSNSNVSLSTIYSTIDFLTTPSQDSNVFKRVVRSVDLPLTFSNLDARFLYDYGGDLLSSITLYTPGNEGPLPTESNSHTYFPTYIDESFSVYSMSTNYTFTQSGISTITEGLTTYNLTNIINLGGSNYKFQASGSFQLDGPIVPPQPCLLKGTLVKTPHGYKPIEMIKEGDTIVSHCKMVKKVTKVGKWECKYDGHSLAQTMYKIPSGSYGADKDVYLSHFHKVSNGKMMLYPTTIGLEKADPTEFVTDGKYVLYHLQVERGLLNHLVVNGECVVDSWVF